MSKMRTIVERSAGGVVCREVDGCLQVALICTRHNDSERWQLPKGLVAKGEKPEATAQREVREETGLDAELVSKLQTIEYWYRTDLPARVHKFVTFYLMRYVSGRVEDHDQEVEEVRWFPIDAAIEALTFATEKKVVAQARQVMSVSK